MRSKIDDNARSCLLARNPSVLVAIASGTVV